MLRLLIADDHPLCRQGLRRLFDGMGHVEVVSESGNGLETLNRIIALQPDIALIDLGMPGVSGVKLLAEVRARGIATRLIVMSMHDDPALVQECLDAGASGYLTKTSPTADILNALSAVQRGNRYVSPELTRRLTGVLAETNPLEGLSSREQQVLGSVLEGETSRAIAARLNLSVKTVESYRSRIMQKLGVGDIPSLTRLALRHGFIR
jgi:DNA-binding NarL/FixJ family response regulator